MVRARYGGASDMWIHRKQQNAGFPAPVYLGASRPYWRRSDLLAWESRTLGADPPKNKGHRTKAA
jgi:predicted DNA-binding transcriptional regulator AlpA